MSVALSSRRLVVRPLIGGGGSFVLYSNTGGAVFLNPEFDYKEQYKKDAERHRSLSGEEYVYQWGYFKRWKFSVVFITSADATTVNSWWSTNADLVFKFADNNTTDLVHIVNRSSPFGKRMKGPYDLFRGVIELETYT